MIYLLKSTQCDKTSIIGSTPCIFTVEGYLFIIHIQNQYKLICMELFGVTLANTFRTCNYIDKLDVFCSYINPQ